MTSKPIAIAVIIAIIMTIAGVAAFYFSGPIMDPKEMSYTTGPSPPGGGAIRIPLREVSKVEQMPSKSADHVSSLVLLTDGNSEFVMTAATLVRTRPTRRRDDVTGTKAADRRLPFDQTAWHDICCLPENLQRFARAGLLLRNAIAACNCSY